MISKSYPIEQVRHPKRRLDDLGNLEMDIRIAVCADHVLLVPRRGQNSQRCQARLRLDPMQSMNSSHHVDWIWKIEHRFDCVPGDLP
jgi:hypothetical protein